MKLELVEVGPIATNCYLVWGSANQALVIDPGSDAEQITALIRSRKLSVAAYLLTHGHTDHISALADIHHLFPAPVCMHAGDFKWAFGWRNQLPPFYSVPRRPAATERNIEDGKEYSDGGLSYRVIHTPGHTPGGVCFHFAAENVLLAGDTIFAGSVGRVDLPGGDFKTLNRSLQRLMELPDDTAIYPGHGPATDMKSEKKTNPFLHTGART